MNTYIFGGEIACVVKQMDVQQVDRSENVRILHYNT